MQPAYIKLYVRSEVTSNLIALATCISHRVNIRIDPHEFLSDQS